MAEELLSRGNAMRKTLFCPDGKDLCGGSDSGGSAGWQSLFPNGVSQTEGKKKPIKQQELRLRQWRGLETKGGKLLVKIYGYPCVGGSSCAGDQPISQGLDGLSEYGGESLPI